MPTDIMDLLIDRSCDRETSLGIGTSSIVLWLMVLLICTDMLAGPLRFFLSYVGLESVVYIPKVMCFLFLTWEIVRGRLTRLLFYNIILLAVYAVVGLLHRVDVFSILFSLFVVLPFLFGIVAEQYLYDKEKLYISFIIAVFIVTALGIYLDVFLEFPWQGFSYTIQGAEIEGAREWTTFGLKRIAGFTRLSAAAAFYIVTSALFLISYSRSWWHKLMLFLVGFPAVLATTNKAGIVGFVLGMASILLVHYPRTLKLFVFGLASTVMLLPLSTVVRSYDIDLSDPVSLILLASFEDRLIHTWPDFVAAVSQFGNPVTGVGFGGIGSAIKFSVGGSREVFAFADNFALYLYGCFGVLAVALFFYLAHITCNLFTSKHRIVGSLAPVMVAIFAVSITTDIIEAQILALMLGIAIASYRNEKYTSNIEKGLV
jgi:hypothetical protein